MNVPNKLTVTRLILAPVLFFWFYAFRSLNFMNPVLYSVVLLVLFLLSELTDLLDGKIARRKNLVTDLGKVMDPFADCLCHLTYFTCFTVAGFMPVYCFVIILWRELSQSFVRMLMMGKNTPMAANIFGKTKTCFYALTSFCGFGYFCLLCNGSDLQWMMPVMGALSILSACFAVVSFVIYIRDIVKSGILDSMTR